MQDARQVIRQLATTGCLSLAVAARAIQLNDGLTMQVNGARAVGVVAGFEINAMLIKLSFCRICWCFRR